MVDKGPEANCVTCGRYINNQDIIVNGMCVNCCAISAKKSRETQDMNAIITGASLSTADHGLLSSFIHLDYGNSGQGFGGFALYMPNKPEQSTSAAGLWIWRVMEIAGVSEWANLKGRTIRVRADHEKVHGIGHIIKDKWFFPAEEFALLERPSGQV